MVDLVMLMSEGSIALENDHEHYLRWSYENNGVFQQGTSLLFSQWQKIYSRAQKPNRFWRKHSITNSQALDLARDTSDSGPAIVEYIQTTIDQTKKPNPFLERFEYVVNFGPFLINNIDVLTLFANEVLGQVHPPVSLLRSKSEDFFQPGTDLNAVYSSLGQRVREHPYSPLEVI